MKRIILDDYNQNIPKEQDVIGAVTTTWGHLALRNGWKIIEAYENEGRNHIQGKVLATMGGGQLLIIQLVTSTAVWMGYAQHFVQRRMMQVYV